jgi:hypothetical protein
VGDVVNLVFTYHGECYSVFQVPFYHVVAVVARLGVHHGRLDEGGRVCRRPVLGCGGAVGSWSEGTRFLVGRGGCCGPDLFDGRRSGSNIGPGSSSGCGRGPLDGHHVPLDGHHVPLDGHRVPLDDRPILLVGRHAPSVGRCALLDGRLGPLGSRRDPVGNRRGVWGVRPGDGQRPASRGGMNDYPAY